MNVSNRDVELSSFFPFSECGHEFCARALELGKCVKYSTGESVLLNDSPAKHCGVIIEGQAVAFKFDANNRRYQVCLDEGCFVGLETLHEGSSYQGKIVAAGDLEIFFWNREGLQRLNEESEIFASGIRMLDEGRSYQEHWLIPETDITDPVLTSAGTHWLSVFSPAFVILPVLFMFEWACAMMVRRYPVVWLFIFGLFAAAGSLLYRLIQARSNERLILTDKNAILIPRSETEETAVIRLFTLQSLTLEQNALERLINAGRIVFQTDTQKAVTSLIRSPKLTGSLIRNFAQRSALGRYIPLRSGNETVMDLRKSQDSVKANAEADVKAVSPDFRTIEFRAHWALLLKMIIKPLLLLAVSLAVLSALNGTSRLYTLRKILGLVTLVSVGWICHSVVSWRSHRFSIEEDCVKDYSYSPMTREDQNLALNHKIQSVRYSKIGFFQNLFNYGTVYILAGEGELSFDYISDPKRVQQQIKETCALYEAKRFKDEETRRREYIDGLVSEIRQENGG